MRRARCPRPVRTSLQAAPLDREVRWSRSASPVCCPSPTPPSPPTPPTPSHSPRGLAATGRHSATGVVWHYALRLWCHTTPSATCPPSALIGSERFGFARGRGPLPRSTGEPKPLAGIFHSLATLARRLRAGRRCAADSLRSFQLHICALRYGSFLLRRLQRHTTGSVPSLRSCVFVARSALATALSSAYQRTLNTHRSLRGVAPPAPPLLRLVCSPSGALTSSALRPAE